MGGNAKLALALALAVLLTIVVVACGGDSTTTSGAGAGGKGKQPKSAVEGPGSSSGGGSAEFITPGGDNSVQNFGQEASAAEREAASDVLEAYMWARSEDAWAKQCAYLAKAAIEPLKELIASSPQFKEDRGCVGVLAALGGRSAAPPINTMTGPIGSLRVGSGRAFALYHGIEGIDYVIQMTREGGGWKVAVLAPLELS